MGRATTRAERIAEPTYEMQRAHFLEQLKIRPIVSAAGDSAKISRSTLYEWRKELPEFALAWDDALRIGVGALEDAAFERAFGSYGKPHKDGTPNRVGSDLLTIFLLKAHKPDLYREQHAVGVLGGDGKLVQPVLEITVTPDKPTT